jgi:predicted transcriptional regulator
MEININDAIKIRILKQLSDEKVYSIYLLAKLVEANNTTVKRNCNFLHKTGLIEISRVTAEESASGVPSYRVKITQEGLKAVKKLNASED